MTRVTKGLDDFLPDFATALTEARSDRRHEIRWIRTKFPAKGRDACGPRAFDRPPPTGVHRRHDPKATIGKQDGSAIGNPHDDGHRRIVRHDRVRLGRIPAPGRTATDHRNLGAMHLSDQPNRCGSDLHLRGDNLPFFGPVAQFQISNGE